MINADNYFRRYLGYEMGMISNNNLTPHNNYFESYQALDSRLLLYHAEAENNPGAMEELGEEALFFEKNVEKALQFLKQASQLGHGEASALLAQIYRTSEYGVYDLEASLKYVQLSAEQGSPFGMFNLSCAYYKGKEKYEGYGFEMDKSLAFQWSVKAKDQAISLFEFIMNNRCSKSFQQFFQRLLDLIIKTTCTSVEQLIDGDGVAKDIVQGKKILLESRNLFLKYIGQSIPDFDALLREINKKQEIL